MDIPKEELMHLIRDKYHGNAQADVSEDMKRLAAGEPLAYVIGWIHFLGLDIFLDSKPLIPRPETEWWTELLIEHLKVRFAGAPFTLLDLCAGSGAVGLAILAACPNAHVFFGELHEPHAKLIEKNIDENNLDGTRAVVRTGDLFAPFLHDTFDIIAANPPYIPQARALEKSVIDFEPAEALFAGTDGLDLIRRVATHSPHHLPAGGELWMECDTSHAGQAAELLREQGAREATIRTDLYGRERLVLAYY
ncbi:MAG: Protein-N(5)-glutamine methyltransferase PrmC [Parcubacteria group bacterium]|nr:Protein-N(5)-glutamine methyltransferase PrmC [Parcubacteria group bacterium]